MSYHLDFTDRAKKEISIFKKSGNKVLLKKLFLLLKEITEHPYTGTGKPEALRHQLSGCWSCRINKEPRLVYEVVNDTVIILSARGHY